MTPSLRRGARGPVSATEPMPSRPVAYIFSTVTSYGAGQALEVAKKIKITNVQIQGHTANIKLSLRSRGKTIHSHAQFQRRSRRRRISCCVARWDSRLNTSPPLAGPREAVGSGRETKAPLGELVAFIHSRWASAQSVSVISLGRKKAASHCSRCGTCGRPRRAPPRPPSQRWCSPRAPPERPRQLRRTRRWRPGPAVRQAARLPRAP